MLPDYAVEILMETKCGASPRRGGRPPDAGQTGSGLREDANRVAAAARRAHGCLEPGRARPRLAQVSPGGAPDPRAGAARALRSRARPFRILRLGRPGAIS